MRERTNIYLDETQLKLLRAVAQTRGSSVAALIREAVDTWLRDQGARAIDEDEWRRRWDALLERGRRRAREEGWTFEEVEGDVMEAVREVRRARTARRR